jgi:hypothetical protein
MQDPDYMPTDAPIIKRSCYCFFWPHRGDLHFKDNLLWMVRHIGHSRNGRKMTFLATRALTELFNKPLLDRFVKTVFEA